jgi:ADP-ribose pyrophosphatase YjhB (NUDIX family)
MLHLIPGPLHRLILRLGHRLRKRWWKLSQKLRSGVSVIAFDEAGRVLLVRHGYGSGVWSLPGGGLRAGEDPEACARREMVEELGCELEELMLVKQFDEILYGAPHRAILFTARFAGEPKADGREIVEIGWFARGELPQPLSRFAAERLKRIQPHG